MAKLKNITGQKFGRLIAIRLAGSYKHGGALWECACDCGNTSAVWGAALRNGNTRSCGCLHDDAFTTLRHGHATRKHETSEYRTYKAAKARCNNPNNEKFKDYGGRGIEFRFTSFEQFLEAVGLKPGPTYSIDRINNDGHYEPGNVRWATLKEQRANRRPQATYAGKPVKK